MGAIEESGLEFIQPPPHLLCSSVNFVRGGAMNCVIKPRQRGGACICARGRVFGLAVLSICLHPRPFPKEGGMALNCLVLHQLTKALPSRIREEQGLLRAVGKERERESRRK